MVYCELVGLVGTILFPVTFPNCVSKSVICDRGLIDFDLRPLSGLLLLPSSRSVLRFVLRSSF